MSVAAHVESAQAHGACVMYMTVDVPPFDHVCFLHLLLLVHSVFSENGSSIEAHLRCRGLRCRARLARI